jgi:hypothetical protein
MFWGFERALVPDSVTILLSSRPHVMELEILDDTLFLLLPLPFPRLSPLKQERMLLCGADLGGSKGLPRDRRGNLPNLTACKCCCLELPPVSWSIALTLDTFLY